MSAATTSMEVGGATQKGSTGRERLNWKIREVFTDNLRWARSHDGCWVGVRVWGANVIQLQRVPLASTTVRKMSLLGVQTRPLPHGAHSLVDKTA